MTEIYARWLDWGTRIALAALIAAFLAYVTGAVPAAVAVAELPQLWSLPVGRYLAATAAPSGWGWLGLLGRGDYLNYVGVALLGLVTVAGYLRAVPALLARGERLQAGFAIAQIIVLLFAASGLLAGGH
jgi:hypothetical protein